MMVAVLFSLNMQRSSIDARIKMMSMEASTQATEVGVKALEYIGSRAFDRVIIQQGAVMSPLTLTPEEEFGWEREFAECAAIEDFHHMKPFVTTVAGVDYEVTATVRYVQDVNGTMVPSAVPTFIKEVNIEVTGAYMNAPIKLSRAFTYS